MTSILFVCLGNICRSAAAHGIMQHMIDEAQLADRFTIDSAGTYGGHQGDLPDPRMRQPAQRRGSALTPRARQVREADLSIAMDDANFQDLKQMAPTVEDEKKIRRMCRYLSDPHIDHIPDPYYSGADGFELVLDLLEDGCRNLLNTLLHHNYARQ